MNGSLTPGEYIHYKGGTYTVLSVAKDSTNEREGTAVVVYKSHSNGETYCRDLAEFVQPVEWPDGSTKGRFVPAE
jgi:hypothetical protein